MTFHEELMQKFPIRRSKEQKEAFRAWAAEKAKNAHWDVRVEETSRGKNKNVIIGDPEHAAVVFTAHYDTPANMMVPNLMMPRNIPLYFLYNMGVVLALLLISGLCSGVLILLGQVKLGQVVALGIYFGALMLMMNGPSNRNNANDNTSGVAAVMSIMATLAEADRSKAAFILFDNEEKGLLGSKNYAKDHVQQQYMRLVVNMDCVGVGDNVLIISKKMARRCTGYSLMERCLAETEGCTAHFFDAMGSVGSSDHKSFKCGVAVYACKKKPVVGFYTPNIHTRRDTQCCQGNIDYLTSAMSSFVHQLGASEEAA